MDPRNFDADLMSEMFSAMGKELKLARAKIKSLEDQDNRSRDFKARAESAENALGILKKNFEDVCREKQQLQTALDELRDSKTGVKKEIEDVDHIMAPPSTEIHPKLSPSMKLADADRVQDLETALEIYYRKYKEQKKSKNQLREASRELEEKLLQTVSKLDEKNDELESLD
ncbi:hypothetical protein BDN70DRAFT_152093 [Pholiota conissans]|uniref:Uncharacterized protein n=1 Tax=Pholiota conissans TaxID=109636 RepID=A0A9P5YX92_9AGAR|nr:hypothetical protein BDN70DRAFT_152093 [Pholiota conissans]